MIWVNLLQDTLASLSLATEHPSNDLLRRKPYGRQQNIVSPIMMRNIICHAAYQLAVLFYMLFAGAYCRCLNCGKRSRGTLASELREGEVYEMGFPSPADKGVWGSRSSPSWVWVKPQPRLNLVHRFFKNCFSPFLICARRLCLVFLCFYLATGCSTWGLIGLIIGLFPMFEKADCCRWTYELITGDRFLDIDSDRDDEYLSAPTQHYTFVFNVLVMMTLFNEINARKIDGSTNVFAGLHRSRMFLAIWTISFLLQVNYNTGLVYHYVWFRPTRIFPAPASPYLYPTRTRICRYEYSPFPLWDTVTKWSIKYRTQY